MRSAAVTAMHMGSACKAQRVGMITDRTIASRTVARPNAQTTEALRHRLLTSSLMVLILLGGPVLAVTIDNGASVQVPGDHASPWQITDLGLDVGVVTNGTLTIHNGGEVDVLGSSVLNFGVQAGSNGVVNVRGPGSVLNTYAGSRVGVGSIGNASLNIEDGGLVKLGTGSVYLYIGYFAGSISDVTVTGVNSRLELFGASGSPSTNPCATFGFSLAVGVCGNATLTIAQGGVVSVGDGVVVGNGRVDLAVGGGVGTINIGAAPGSTPVDPGTLDAATIVVGLGNGTINFNHTSSSYVFAPSISGPGLVQILAGTKFH